MQTVTTSYLSNCMGTRGLYLRQPSIFIDLSKVHHLFNQAYLWAFHRCRTYSSRYSWVHACVHRRVHKITWSEVYIADLQLYNVALKNKWSYPLRWKNLIVGIGGRHMLMSFIGAIASLIKRSWLEDKLSPAYNDVDSLLSVKAWRKAMRGLCMVVTKLLKELVLIWNINNEAIEEALRSAPTSYTVRPCVDCLIYPVHLAHMFIGAKFEANYLLHIYYLSWMLSYFFASGHWN